MDLTQLTNVSETHAQVRDLEARIRSSLVSVTQPPSSAYKSVAGQSSKSYTSKPHASCSPIKCNDGESQKSLSQAASTTKTTKPINESEVRRWMEELGLGGQFADALIKEGITDAQRLRTLLSLTVADFKLLLQTDQIYIAAQFKDALIKLFNDDDHSPV